MARRALSDREILAQIGAARARTRMRAKTEPRAKEARYDWKRGRIEIELTNGCAFAFSPELAQGLQGASAEDLAQVEIELDGEGLHWEKLDADLLVPELLRGVTWDQIKAFFRTEAARLFNEL